MNNQIVINRSIDIINLTINPDPIKCIRLISNLLLNEDPISELVYELAKSELSSAVEIIENIEHEGDVRGALNRILSHLESAFILARNYYTKKIEGDIFVNDHVSWFMSKNGQIVHEDIVKICYYQLVCHKLLGSSEERLYGILSKIPLNTDYMFGNYTEAMSKLFNKELWESIMCNRKNDFARSMCTAGISILLPGMIPVLMNVVNLKKLRKFLDSKLDKKLSSVIFENKFNFSNIEYYFPRRDISF